MMEVLSSLSPVKRPSLKDRKRCGTVSVGPCAMRVKRPKGVSSGQSGEESVDS
jgi:hypothetical protein